MAGSCVPLVAVCAKPYASAEGVSVSECVPVRGMATSICVQACDDRKA